MDALQHLAGAVLQPSTAPASPLPCTPTQGSGVMSHRFLSSVPKPCSVWLIHVQPPCSLPYPVYSTTPCGHTLDEYGWPLAINAHTMQNPAPAAGACNAPAARPMPAAHLAPPLRCMQLHQLPQLPQCVCTPRRTHCPPLPVSGHACAHGPCLPCFLSPQRA